MASDNNTGFTGQTTPPPDYIPTSPLELHDSEYIAGLKKDVLSFVQSPIFSQNPITWDDEEHFFLAYYAYCEGWGVKKDVEQAIRIMTLGSAKGGPFIMRLLAEHFMYGFYGGKKDTDSALELFAAAFNLTDDGDERSYCAMSISRLYLEYFHTCFAATYAMPWMKLCLAYGNREDRCTDAIRSFIESVEPEVKEHSAADLLREFNRDHLDFINRYEEHAVTVKGRIGRVRQHRETGIYFAELFPTRKSGPQLTLPGKAACIQCIMEDDNDLFDLSGGDINTVRGFCIADGRETIALTECEFYVEPPIDVPPLPGKKQVKRVIRNADFTPRRKG